MKNLKMSFLIVLVIFSIIGCKPNSEINKSDLDLNLDLLTENPFQTTLPSQNIATVEMKGLNIWQGYSGRGSRYNNLIYWQDYIMEKFGISLNISYDHYNERIYYLNYYNDDKSQQANNFITKHIENPVFIDLSPYIYEYGWNEFIDQKELDLVTRNKKIAAIPLKASEFILPRYYNKSYLESLNMDVPTNTMELYQYLKQTKELNLGNEKFYPMFVPSSDFFPCLADIFRAYNTYVNSSLNSTIEFNPNIGSFEDAVFSEDFETALTFIRELQADNLLNIYGRSYSGFGQSDYLNRFEESLFKADKGFATEYFSIFNGVTFQNSNMAEPTYDYSKGYYLQGSNDRNICELRSNMVFYLFPNVIKNIDTVMEQFDMIMTEQEFYADLQYGIEGRDYELVGDKIVSNPPASGKFVGILQIANQKSLSEEDINTFGNIEAGMLYEKNVFNNLFSFLKTEDIGKIRQEHYLEYFMYSDIPPQDVIEMYKKEFKKYGFEQLINQMNEKLGQPTIYDYGD